MLSNNEEKASTINKGLKKDILVNIFLLIIAILAYIFWGANWVFWVVLVLAIGNLAVVLVLKRLLNKVDRENGKKRV